MMIFRYSVLGGAPIQSINLDNFMQTERIFSVNEITRMIKSVIEDSDQLRDVGVRGTQWKHKDSSASDRIW